MTTSHVDMVERGYAAWRRGDLEGAVAEFHPEFELIENPAFPEAGVYRGADEFVRYAASFLEMFEEWRLDVEEIVDAGDDVLAFVRWRVRGKASQALAELPIIHRWTFSDGRPIRMRSYFDRDEALAAVRPRTA